MDDDDPGVVGDTVAVAVTRLQVQARAAGRGVGNVRQVAVVHGAVVVVVDHADRLELTIRAQRDFDRAYALVLDAVQAG